MIRQAGQVKICWLDQTGAGGKLIEGKVAGIIQLVGGAAPGVKNKVVGPAIAEYPPRHPDKLAIARHGPVTVGLRPAHGYLHDVGFVPHKAAESQVRRSLDDLEHAHQVGIAGDATAVQADVDLYVDAHRPIQARREIDGAAVWCTTTASSQEQSDAAVAFCKSLRK